MSKPRPVWFSLLIVATTFGDPSFKGEEPAETDRALHVIVFESELDASHVKDTLPQKLPLEADFAVDFSRLLGPGTAPISIPNFISPKLMLLDIHTFRPTTRNALKENEFTHHLNRISGLFYQVKLISWQADSYQIGLAGKYGNLKFEAPSVQGRLNKTTILFFKSSQDKVLSIALTPLVAVKPLFSGKTVDQENIEKPKLLGRRTPNYPEKLSSSRYEGTVTAQTIVKRDGLLDLGRILLLECPHQLFARESLATLRDWKFLPGKKDGSPVDMVVEIQVEFRLR